MIQVVGRALGKYGEQLLTEIERRIAEEVGKVRADVNLKARERRWDVVLLPNPLPERRSGRGVAGRP
jgi:hypothetical protein